jgi:hypothetical protein
MDATKKLGQNQKSINLRNSSHRLKYEVDNHMGTQLVELNETIRLILVVKRFLKMLEDHARRTTSRQMKQAQKCQP